MDACRSRTAASAASGSRSRCPCSYRSATQPGAAARTTIPLPMIGNGRRSISSTLRWNSRTSVHCSVPIGALPNCTGAVVRLRPSRARGDARPRGRDARAVRAGPRVRMLDRGRYGADRAGVGMAFLADAPASTGSVVGVPDLEPGAPAAAHRVAARGNRAPRDRRGARRRASGRWTSSFANGAPKQTLDGFSATLDRRSRSAPTGSPSTTVRTSARRRAVRGASRTPTFRARRRGCRC